MPKISELTASGTLDGSEVFAVVKSGATKKATAGNVADLVFANPLNHAFTTVSFGAFNLSMNDGTKADLKSGSYFGSGIIFKNSDGTSLGEIYADYSGNVGVTVNGYTGGIFLAGESGLYWNGTKFLQSDGALLDSAGEVLLNRTKMALINDASSGDIVAKFNTLLAELKSLGLLADS